MTSIYLNKRELDSIIEFMRSFTSKIDTQSVEVIVDGENGIGSVLTAKLHGVNLNGHLVDVSTTISDESNW